MFGGDGEGVEEHQEDYEPVEDVRFNCRATLPPPEPVPPAPVAAGKGQGGKTGLSGRPGLSIVPKAYHVTSYLSVTGLALLHNLVAERSALHQANLALGIYAVHL